MTYVAVHFTHPLALFTTATEIMQLSDLVTCGATDFMGGIKFYERYFCKKYCCYFKFNITLVRFLLDIKNVLTHVV